MLTRMKAALSSGALRRSNRALTAPLPPRCFRTHPMSTASNVKASRHGYRLIGGAACALGAAFFAGITAQNPVHAAAPTPATSTAFNKKEWTAYPLMDKVKLNHNTTLLRFKLPEGVTAGLTVASMLSVGFRPAGESATENDKVTARPYTPTSRTQDKGFIEFVIKAYPAPGGVVSRHLTSLKKGEEALFKGPWVKFKYEPNKWKKVGMIAGGTGVTPMLQVAREVLENSEDQTKLQLVFCNRSEEDIMLRDTLDALSYMYPNRFSVHYVLDRAPPGWRGSEGYVTSDIVERHLPSPNEDCMIMVCGPNPMISHVCGPKIKRKQGPVGGLLKDAGFSSEQVFKF